LFGTMTWVGLDVHARSTHAAAIDSLTGELTRWRFGPGVEGPVSWLKELPGPVRACYEAGPTGFGLYRAAVAAGVGMQVIAPGKTPRGASDRVKTDRKDAELLARLLLAGGLTRVVVPPPEVEAAREMTRAHDACRRDRWLSTQQFDEPASDLVFADLLASVDGLTARKQAIALQLSQVAVDERWWPTVARLRAFRGIDTPTALSIHLDRGRREQAAAPIATGLCPIAVRRKRLLGRDLF
jgi:transposase